MSNSSSTTARLAVFDYDGTIVSGQSGLLIARYMLSLGIMKLRHAARLFRWGFRYVTHLPHSEEEARELVFEGLLDLTPEEVEDFMREFHDTALAPLYRSEAEREITARKAEGCTVLLVSATFSTLANIAAERLGVHAVIATVMELNESGYYSGSVQGDVIEGYAKYTAVRSWADEIFGPENWELVYAYGDHYSDRGLLGMAKHPYAVCPKPLLRRYARKHGWMVLDWSE